MNFKDNLNNIQKNMSSKINNLIFFSIIMSFSLWDFYIDEIRIFDFIGVILFILGVFFIILTNKKKLFYLDGQKFISYIFIITLLLIYIFYGVIQNPDNMKPSIGIFLGIISFFIIYTFDLDDISINRNLNYIIVIHILFILTQIFTYYFLSYPLNFHSFLGLKPRLLSSIFRPAGLFLEPAIFSSFIIMIFFIRRVRKFTFNYIDWMMIMSVGLSLSLWGIVVSILLLIWYRPIISAISGVFLTGLMLSIIDFNDFLNSPIYKLFEKRLNNIFNDASAQQRFGGLGSFVENIFHDPRVVFGNGINNFFDEFGSNGLSFIINSLGFVGFSFLFLGLLTMTNRRNWVLFSFSLVLLMTAAPLWKTSFFWAWLALMLRPLSQQLSSPELIKVSCAR